jgi:hypothetical protein
VTNSQFALTHEDLVSVVIVVWLASISVPVDFGVPIDLCVSVDLSLSVHLNFVTVVSVSIQQHSMSIDFDGSARGWRVEAQGYGDHSVKAERSCAGRCVRPPFVGGGIVVAAASGHRLVVHITPRSAVVEEPNLGCDAGGFVCLEAERERYRQRKSK